MQTQGAEMRELSGKPFDDLWGACSHGTDEDTVRMIYRKGYEDGMKYADMQKERPDEVCNICGKQHIDPSFNCLLNQVILDLNSARASKAAAK